MKKTISIVLAVILVLGVVGYFLYDYATDTLVKKTIQIVKDDPAIQKEVDKIASEMLDKTEENEVPNDASAEKPEPSPSKAPSGGSLSIDDLQPTDKEYVMSIYKRFTASEVSHCSAMLADGLTAAEKKEIKAIVYAKVSSGEVSKLLAIAKKYQ